MHSYLFILGGGASVSSELPTYNGRDGLYANPEIKKSLTVDILKSNPLYLWKNITQIARKLSINKIGSTYKTLKAISDHTQSFFITQNVDSLILKCGIPEKQVWEIHGNLRKMSCMKCTRNQKINFANPRCEQGCDGFCRPDVKLYGEEIEIADMNYTKAWIDLKKPEYVIVIGSKLKFPYLRNLVNDAKKYGAHVIFINPLDIELPSDATHLKKSADEGLLEFIQAKMH
jgi:NAD-dependent deacetylase